MYSVINSLLNVLENTQLWELRARNFLFPKATSMREVFSRFIRDVATSHTKGLVGVFVCWEMGVFDQPLKI